MLYKVLTVEEYAQLPATLDTPYYGTSFDLSTGYHHLSTSLHLPLVLKNVFSTESQIWLLAIPREAHVAGKASIESKLEFYYEVINGIEGSEESIKVTGPLDVFREVALRRRCVKVEGEWDLGELQW